MPSERKDTIQRDFDLLQSIIRPKAEKPLKVDIQKIENIVKIEIPSVLKKNAPPNYYELYMDFLTAYDRFKDFILYEQLIGKKVVALGGGFSSGKSSFINALDGEQALPVDLDPSTSVPTYVVHGSAPQVWGCNVFDAVFSISPRDIKKIAHGFGTGDEDSGGVPLGHILERVVLATPKQKYENLAFLDTPGYSKPDSQKYSARTDEEIARRQLQSCDCLLWFVQADSGTITEEDVKFISALPPEIPKLILLNKADKKPAEELELILTKIRDTLDLRGIGYEDVLPFSTVKPQEYGRAKLDEFLADLNRERQAKWFAKDFKTLFVRCREFYEDEINENRQMLGPLNDIETILDDEANGDALQTIGTLKNRIIKEIKDLEKVEKSVKDLQKQFLSELRSVADKVGISLPEPNEIELTIDTAHNAGEELDNYLKDLKGRGGRNWTQIRDILQDTFAQTHPEDFDRQPGGSGFGQRLAESIRQNCQVDSGNIQLRDGCEKNLTEISRHIATITASENFKAVVKD